MKTSSGDDLGGEGWVTSGVAEAPAEHGSLFDTFVNITAHKIHGFMTFKQKSTGNGPAFLRIWVDPILSGGPGAFRM
ncbi:hypothetical protein [Aquabacterium sp.]|uniref:hypothetical protein n=1 Tax=Aquabacterium sp. TaxID=1872578 RepID=UPI0035B19302